MPLHLYLVQPQRFRLQSPIPFSPECGYEVELIQEHYRPDLLWYADDVFTINRRWFFAYAEKLKSRKLRIPFETISREDRLDEDIIRQLGKMGCYRLWIGSESGSQSVLDAMQRKTNAVRVQQVVRSLQQNGIQAGLFIMLGYDGEETKDIKETVQLLKAANPDVFLTTVAYPIKDTPYDEKVSDRVIRLKSWETGSDRAVDVSGRRSRRFYHFANRWMHGEVPRCRFNHQRERNNLKLAKALANVFLGRLGMLLNRKRVCAD